MDKSPLITTSSRNLDVVGNEVPTSPRGTIPFFMGKRGNRIPALGRLFSNNRELDGDSKTIDPGLSTREFGRRYSGVYSNYRSAVTLAFNNSKPIVTSFCEIDG